MVTADQWVEKAKLAELLGKTGMYHFYVHEICRMCSQQRLSTTHSHITIVDYYIVCER